MTDLERTLESAIYDPEAEEITQRQRCVTIASLDGTVNVLPVDAPTVPRTEEISQRYSDQIQTDPEGKQSAELQYKVSPTFDTFLHQLFEKYGGEYKQTLYRGLAEQGIEIRVAVDLSTNGRIIRGYKLVCQSSSGQITITPVTAPWSAFLDKTESQIRQLCDLHIRRKHERRREAEIKLARETQAGNPVARSVSRTLTSIRIRPE
jgi:hypothetical protein